jgi:nucleotidyltransferase substrate binding protein (TIGR01987 family)
MEIKIDKLKQSISDLEHALSFEAQSRNDSFYYYGIAKVFEVSLEYAWKYLKKRVEADGLEARSPREAIKLAGRIGIISEVKLWLSFIENRNLAVHDYQSISSQEYLHSIKLFLEEAKKLI